MARRLSRSEHPPDKTCARCGRRIEWRKKWERDWDEVRYCSERCRRTRLTATDRALERGILDLLAQRRDGATICPSDAARAVHASTGAGGTHGAGSDGWRNLMEPARQAARRLVARDEVVLTQGGRVVDPSTATGPIRIRRA